MPSSNSYYKISNPNCLIAGNNYLDTATIIYATAYDAVNFPLSNCQVANLYTFTRIVNYGTDETTPNPQDNYYTAIAFDMGATHPIGLVGLLKTSIRTQAKVRVQLFPSNTPDFNTASAIFDSGWVPANGATPDYGALVWGQFTWGDSPADSNLSNFNRHTLIPLVPTSCRYVVIYIDDFAGAPSTGGAANGYLQFARAWASNTYQPSFNVAYGAEIVPIDDTPVTQAQAGNRMYGQQIQRRQVNVTFDQIPISELVGNVLGPIFLRNGKKGEIIIMLQPADIYTVNYQSVYGNVPSVDKLVHQSYNRMGSTLSVEEQV